MPFCQICLQRRLGHHQLGIGPEGITKREPLVPLACVDAEQVQVRVAAATGNVYEEPFPRSLIEFNRHEVPPLRRE